MSDYPEHDKLLESSEERQTIGDFLEWMSSQGMVIGKWLDVSTDPEFEFTSITEVLTPDNMPIADRLALRYGVDQERLEAEKRSMLDEARKANEPEASPA